jgi:GNAT superfamily N-acetyltransferase
MTHTQTFLEREATHSSTFGNAGAADTPTATAAATLASLPTIRQLCQQRGWAAQDLAASVQYLGVDFEFRRQGIGRQLLDVARDVAWAAGCDSERACMYVTSFSDRGWTVDGDDARQGKPGCTVPNVIPLGWLVEKNVVRDSFLLPSRALQCSPDVAVGR